MIRFISYMYCLLMHCRCLLYRYQILKTHKFDIPIISVGNIVVGGTGKTPMVSWLINQCEQNNIQACVITRGYKRKNKEMFIIDGSRVKNPPYSIKQIGDEPFLLLNKHPSIKMVIHNNKIKSIKRAIKTLDFDIIILDDGFQSIYIQRDLDIVMMNADTSKEDLQIIPRGKSREPYRQLQRADFIIINNNDLLETNRNLMDKINCQNIPSIYAQKQYTIRDENNKTISNISGLGELIAVCGIGHPNSFLSALVQHNLAIKKQLIYRDHHQYTERDIQLIYNAMNDLKVSTIITTSKDYNKIQALNYKNKKIIVLDMDLKINNSNSLMKEINKLVH